MSDNLDQLSDDELIELTLNGQREAFGQLVRKYQNRLYNGMVQILRSGPEAEDAVQEAFILALTKLRTFRGKSSFFTWLYRISYNVAMTRLRRRKPVVSMQSAVADLELDFPDEQPDPEDRLVKQERAKQLMEALDKMSEEHRAILVLREMEDMDYSEISEILELPIGTVRSRLHRARIQLRDLLEGVVDE